MRYIVEQAEWTINEEPESAILLFGCGKYWSLKAIPIALWRCHPRLPTSTRCPV